MSKLLIYNAAQLVTVAGEKDPKTAGISGAQMDDLKVIKNGSIICENGLIKEILSEEMHTSEFLEKAKNEYKIIDATGKTVTPGFVDSHTHFIFGGYRAEEYNMRLKGASYMEIMQSGGGIASSVKSTREASENDLYTAGAKRLKSMLKFGVTTVEGKSGYGLDRQTELKQLNVMKALNQNPDQPIEIVPTFMGPHALPIERKNERELFLKEMEIMLPEIADSGLARFADIFCEDNVFTIEESEHFLQKAKDAGLKTKIHADEIVNFGGALLAAKVGTVSADHLLKASDDGLRAMKEAGVIATILPLTAFSLKEDYARAKYMIKEGLTVALATDFNPGSCYSQSIPLLIALATNKMGMSIEQTITAITINGAAALDLSDIIGSIEVGKQADFLIHDCPSYHFLAYNFGVSTVETIIKKGAIYA